jgi:hypothetical protein
MSSWCRNIGRRIFGAARLVGTDGSLQSREPIEAIAGTKTNLSFVEAAMATAAEILGSSGPHATTTTGPAKRLVSLGTHRMDDVECSPSAPLRQIEGFSEGRISGSS